VVKIPTFAVPGKSRQLTILLTGFGPFPGAPFNPTGKLVQHLARVNRPALAGIRRIACVFPTSYAVLDRDFPAAVAEHRPDAILMFGLASRTHHLRVERLAKNVLSASLPDATRTHPAGRKLSAGGATALRTTAPCVHLLRAVRGARVPAALSRDAGRYLCNALYWRALESASQPSGPRIAVFIHVPWVRRHSVPHSRMRRRPMSMDELRRAGEAILRAVVAAVRR
jgi:pyroglutamyl-peptidase